MNTAEAHPFFAMLAAYHNWIHPFPLLAFALGFGVMIMLISSLPYKNRVSLFILAFFWGWDGLTLFTYQAAPLALAPVTYAVQGILFPVQALILARIARTGAAPDFNPGLGWSGKAGLAIMFTALFIYPVAGNISGHAYPAAPVFPEPCPLTIFTFGFLMTARSRIRPDIIVIPFLWSLMGIVAVMKLGVVADALEVMAGVGCTLAILIKNKAFGRI